MASISSMKVGMNRDLGGGLKVPQMLPASEIRGSERETEKNRKKKKKKKKKKKETPWMKMEAMIYCNWKISLSLCTVKCLPPWMELLQT